MTRNWHKPLIWAMWLFKLTAAWTYWHVWEQLPARMAVHFDANWQPNGFTSKEASVELGLGIMAVMLVLITVTTLIIDTLKPSAFWPALVISYVVLAVCWYANYSIVKFNLQAQQVHSERMDGIGESGSQFLVANSFCRGVGASRSEI